MSIRYKFFLAFSILAALACFLALVGFRGIATSGDLVVRLYDGPLTGINHARAAHAELNDARLLLKRGPGDGVDGETQTKLEKLVVAIAADLRIVRERIADRDVLTALTRAEDRVRDWSAAGFKTLEPSVDGLTTNPALFAIAQKGDDAAAALDSLAEIVAAYGSGYRIQAEAAAAAAGTTMLVLALGTALIGLLLAAGFAHSINKPISDAMTMIERAAAGNFTDRIASSRRDEIGRLLQSLAVVQSNLKTRTDEDYAMMEKLDDALNNMSQGLCMFGPDNRLVLWNQRYVKMYRIAPDRLFVGCSQDEMLDARKDAGTAYRDQDEYHTKLQDAIETRSSDGLIAELVDGRYVHVVYRPNQNGGGVSTHEDVTERRLDEARIAHLAFHDQLTGLPNRIAFRDHIARTFGRASVDGESFAVLCIDVDRFKEINDVYGHSAGDDFLAEIGRRLGLACQGCFLARLSGDEFAVVLSGGAGPAAVEALCGRLSMALQTPIGIDAYEIHASFTIGASVYPQDGADVDTLVANAEAALDRAKAEQRGTIRFFEPAMHRQVREKRALQQDIAQALEKNELELYFQPQAVAGGDVFGFEVLLRWHHPLRGMVPPSIFIPLAEEIGAIRAIDEWVLREACREAASWPNPLPIAVNLSPIDFRRSDVPAMILSVLLETGLNPRRLEIEITEGVLIDDFDRTIAVLRRIKGLGVRIAMDDFGSGYSSLSYLQSFPFDKIKIDQTFIAKIGNDGPAAAIIRAILGLGRALALPVIAEGVETQQQLDFLVKEGCNEVQGYLIGRPSPIAMYQHLVARLPGTAELAAIAS